jgi:Ni,Fe-hydrogenase III small subunit
LVNAETDVETLGQKAHETIRKVLGRSLAIREVDAGSCNGCELEIVALSNPVHDLERFGIHFVASPRHADMLLVTGPVTRNMELALLKTYQAMAEPKVVVAVGACGISGGIFGVNYASLGGVDNVLPVDFYVPGCPPRPQALLHGILLAVGRLGGRLGHGSGSASSEARVPSRDGSVLRAGFHRTTPALGRPGWFAFQQELPDHSSEIDWMVLFDTHAVPVKLLGRFPPDTTFAGEHDRVGAAFCIERNHTTSKTLAHSPDRSSREGIAKVDYKDPIPRQRTIAVVVELPTAQLVRLAPVVKAVHQQHIKSSVVALYEPSTILTKYMESVVVAGNEKSVSERDDLRTDLRNGDSRVG